MFKDSSSSTLPLSNVRLHTRIGHRIGYNLQAVKFTEKIGPFIGIFEWLLFLFLEIVFPNTKSIR